LALLLQFIPITIDSDQQALRTKELNLFILRECKNFLSFFLPSFPEFSLLDYLTILEFLTMKKSLFESLKVYFAHFGALQGRNEKNSGKQKAKNIETSSL
jgi:hypothetical protein